jgi:hypothetical protein
MILKYGAFVEALLLAKSPGTQESRGRRVRKKKGRGGCDGVVTTSPWFRQALTAAASLPEAL